MVSGNAQFVLTEHHNTPYINLPKHNHFGLVDIHGSCLKNEFSMNEWFNNYFILKRMFSIRTTEETEVLYLNITDLKKMHKTYRKDFNDIIGKSGVRFQKSLT